MAQYISAYSGDDIDRAVGSFLAHENATRVIYSHPINVNSWVGDTTPYYCNITTSGVYNVGEYPIVYFVDGNTPKQKYELNSKFTVANDNSITVTVYSNVKIAGEVIEVASLSGWAQT